MRVRAGRSGIDVATLVGLTGAFALIISAMVLGGSPGAFLDAPSMLIVLGGTLAVTTVSFSLKDIAATQRVLLKTLVREVHDPRGVARQMLQLAEISRKHGPLALQTILPDLKAEPFLMRSVTLITDGLPADDIEHILRSEVDALSIRHARSAAVLRRAAEVAPSMGLIGTLVGLVQMLGNLQDPATIGPSMAVALITTFYGAILGSMVLSPLAAKLERKSDEESVIKTLYMTAAVSIARQENPRRLEMLLNTILPPNKRLQYFD